MIDTSVCARCVRFYREFSKVGGLLSRGSQIDKKRVRWNFRPVRNLCRYLRGCNDQSRNVSRLNKQACFSATRCATTTRYF